MNQSYALIVLVGMSLLLAWGVASTWYGLKSRKLTPSVEKYCREMTLYWGVINGLIGAFAVLTVLMAFDMYSSDPATQQKAQGLFEFNSLLDVGYIAVGLVVAYVGKSVSDRRLGYGKAIIVQGVFLLVLDGLLSLLP